jgi:hypothetical protein
LARANLALDGQAYVVYDGHELRACRDAAAAIAMVQPAATLKRRNQGRF